MSRDESSMRTHTTGSEVAVSSRTSSQHESWHNITKTTSTGNDAPVLRSSLKATHQQKPRRPGISTALSAHIFDQLPTQINHLILRRLMLQYMVDMEVDAAGMLKDLRACCLISKRWLHSAREHLYYNIWLLRNAPSRRRRFSRSKSRLELLMRTLTEGPPLAQLVQRISVTPSLKRELLTPKSFLSHSRHAMELLCDAIELCPLLQQLDGFLPELAPQYAKFFQTLLRRPYLRSLIWWTHPNAWFTIDLNRLGNHGDSWQSLQTLVLSQGNSSKSMGMTPGSILRLLRRIPALQSLMLAGLSREDINNEALKLLPALARLRLDDLVGVDDEGILNISEGEHAALLKSLTLSGLQIKSMETIVSVLDGCYTLERLRFVQMQAPGWSLDDSDPVEYLLESDSLRYLHWETLIPSDATKDLAESISRDAFPALLVIKAPCDEEGHLQAVCRPIYEQSLTPDDVKFMDRGRLHDSSYSVRLAQLRAQLRVQDQRQHPSFNFIVKDENETLQHTDVIGAYLGRLGSKIEYRLEPDIPGSTVALSHLSDFLEPHMQAQVDASKSSLDLSVARSPAYTFDLLF